MTRRCLLLLLLTAVLAGSAAAREADDEPTFLDKKLSYWLTLLESGKDAKARRRGVIAVEQIGHAASRKVVPALAKAVREDSDPVVRATAARAAGRAMAKALETARADKRDDLPRFDTARDALAAALRSDKSDAVREAAAVALGDLGRDARPAVGALAFALKDRSPATVRAAAAALRQVGPDAREAQAELQALLADQQADTEARTDAARCLGQIRPEEGGAVNVLRDVFTDPKADLPLRVAAAEAAGRLGATARPIAADLGKLLIARDSAAELRVAVVTALDALGGEAKPALPALIAAVNDVAIERQKGDTGRTVRCLAMHALGRLGKDLDDRRKDTVQALLKATDDPNTEVSVTALETLAALTADGNAGESDVVVKKIDAILLREGRKAIREAAEAARERIRPKK
ncbi:MAG: HEAT repeat domain-containing protein [Gemmataceae bacterium]